MLQASKLPTFYISHGGGPWPWVPHMRTVFSELEHSLNEIVANLETIPSAVLMVSGHWETQTTRVMASKKPPMVYDYSGFPSHTYEIVYP